jgi:hypothetical protein
MKKYNDINNKANQMTISNLRYTFAHNVTQEIDWNLTLRFISNKNKSRNNITNDEDTKERAYKVKNFLKELPTYEVLYRNNIYGIDSATCLLCKKENEDWDHIWHCEENNNETDEKILFEVLTKMEKNEDEKDIIKYRYAIENFVMEPSKVLKNGAKKIQEVKQGLVNRRWSEMGTIKDDKKLLFKVFEYLYERYKKIWRDRCIKIVKLEEEKGITKMKKRKQYEREGVKEDVINSEDIKNKKLRKKEENTYIEEKKILIINNLTGNALNLGINHKNTFGNISFDVI